MNRVLDASAILAFLQGETGADLVETQLESGVRCGAANWSEIAQKVRAADGDWDLARALLLSYELDVEPVIADDAEWAALRWRRGRGYRSQTGSALHSRSESTQTRSPRMPRGAPRAGSVRSGESGDHRTGIVAPSANALPSHRRPSCRRSYSVSMSAR